MRRFADAWQAQKKTQLIDLTEPITSPFREELSAMLSANGHQDHSKHESGILDSWLVPKSTGLPLNSDFMSTDM